MGHAAGQDIEDGGLVDVMDITQFEKEINELFIKDEYGLFASGPELDLFVHLDGCLGCRYKGKLIPCEEVPWDEALEIIIAFIRKKVLK